MTANIYPGAVLVDEVIGEPFEYFREIQSGFVAIDFEFGGVTKEATSLVVELLVEFVTLIRLASKWRASMAAQTIAICIRGSLNSFRSISCSM